MTLATNTRRNLIECSTEHYQTRVIIALQAKAGPMETASKEDRR